MQALRWYGKKDVRLEQVYIPTITDPENVVCRVTATTICNSDLHLYRGDVIKLQKGDILGDEWARIVEEVGNGVKLLNPGD